MSHPTDPAAGLRALRARYAMLQALCTVTWGANVVYMIFGVIFINQLGVSVSGIFALNMIVIAVSFAASTLVNKRSDKIRRRKEFMIAAYVLRTGSIFLLVIGNDIWVFVLHHVLVSLLNPISFDVAIIYELGERMERLEVACGQAARKNASTRYYLRYRMLGSIGWAVAAPLAGLGIAAVNEHPGWLVNVFPNLPGFRLFLLLSTCVYLVATVVFATRFTEDPPASEPAVTATGTGDPTPVTTTGRRARAAGMAPLAPLALLLATMFLFQAGSSLFQTPYGVFLTEFSGGNLALVGVSYFCSAILEAPLFMIALRIIDTRGYEASLSVSFLLEITRVMLTIAAIPLGMPVVVVFLQMMNSFSFRWPSLAHGVSVTAPERKASGMNYMLVLEKAGGFAGSLIGTLVAGATGVDGAIGAYVLLFAISLVFLVANTSTFVAGTVALKARTRGRNP